MTSIRLMLETFLHVLTNIRDEGSYNKHQVCSTIDIHHMNAVFVFNINNQTQLRLNFFVHTFTYSPSIVLSFLFTRSIHKDNRRLYGHVQCYAIRHKERNGSRRLRQHVHRIDEGVQQTTDKHHAEQIAGDHWQRIGQHINEGDQHERNDVLHIVAVSAPNTFHVRIIEAHLSRLTERQVLRIGESLIRDSLYAISDSIMSKKYTIILRSHSVCRYLYNKHNLKPLCAIV